MVPFFTTAQWTELQRQAMIYKKALYNVGYSKNGTSVEAGRCKRTDGKKWRCSRDVARPHQKYCERHLHRGRRPRSGKPVEEVNNKNNGDENHQKPKLDQQTPKQFTAADDDEQQPLLLFNAKTDLCNISTAPSHKGTNRDFGLTMESGVVGVNGGEQNWHHLLESNMGFSNEGSSIYDSSAVFHNVDQQPLDQHVLSYSNFRASKIDPPIDFIDTWSINNHLNNTTNNNNNIDNVNHKSFSPSINMSSITKGGGNGVLGGKMGNVQMRDGVGFYDEDSRWLSPVCCWEASFGPGGPLAEALCVNPLSSHNSISDRMTNVSSPSGVLQTTLLLFSQSGGSVSVCNNPSEIAFQRIK